MDVKKLPSFGTISIMQYNVLAQRYATQDADGFPFVDPGVLKEGRMLRVATLDPLKLTSAYAYAQILKNTFFTTHTQATT